MKILKIALLVGVSLTASASATTIIAGGGLAGATFYSYFAGILSNNTTTILTGTYNGSIFTQFASGDPSPIGISNVPSLAGKWEGNAIDKGPIADWFNGRQIWFKISTFGLGGTAYFTSQSAIYFPTNNGGVGDSLVFNSSDLTVVAGEYGNPNGFARGYEAGDGRIYLGIPEPSTTLLGAFGVVLGIFRRRR